MSVKTMTDEQIDDDLEAIQLAWPDGLPPEQNDRVNALLGERKRRGTDTPEPSRAKTKARRPARPDVKDMDRGELEAELRDLSRTLSKNPDDVGMQERFADVRFELRAINGAGEEKPAKRSSPVPPRALELPDDDEVKQFRKATKNPVPVEDDEARVIDDDDDEVMPAPSQRRSQPVVAATTTRDIRRRGPPVAKKPTPTTVNGFTATAVLGRGGQVGVDFSYEKRTSTGVVVVAHHFPAGEWDDLIKMAMAVRTQVVEANAAKPDDDED